MGNYFSNRMAKLGVNETNNCIRVNDRDGHAYDFCFFSESNLEDKSGMKINYLSPAGIPCQYDDGSGKLKDFYRIRLSDSNGNGKYHQPWKSGTFPYLPPGIIKKYKAGTEINTLIIVEGEFKAFAGDIAGLDIIGIGGIHSFKDKANDGESVLHPYIIDIINTCKVRNVIFLFDADVISENIIKDLITKQKDLGERLLSFYTSVKLFRELMKPLNVDVYFSHISGIYETNAKGLDDLLHTFKDKQIDIIDDLLSFEKAKEYFFSINITDNSLGKLYKYFLLSTSKKSLPLDFYEKFTAIIQEDEFCFKGITYKHNGVCLEIIKHPDAEKYVRVGTDYYLKGYKLTTKKEKVNALLPWKIGIIKLDHGHIPNFLKMIPKYQSFTNVPDNTSSYQQSIEGCYNLYEGPKYIPIAGDPSKTINFLKHIFGQYYEVAIDLLTIKHRYPIRNLPIVCLVSREQGTGKSTFVKFICKICGNNAIRLGNEDFSSHFNLHWVSKSIIAIEETCIDKKLAKEKIKRLCTDNVVNLEAKSKDIVTMDFWGLFILCSNNEDNFIHLDDDDTRFFVVKVTKPEIENKNLLSELEEEIPYFLHYLETRTITHPDVSRLWFAPETYITEALRNAKKESKSLVEKEMINCLDNLFCYAEDINGNILEKGINCTPKLLAEQIQGNLRTYNGLAVEIERILKTKWNLKPEKISTRFAFYKPYEKPDLNNEYSLAFTTHKIVGKPYTITYDFINSLKNEN